MGDNQSTIHQTAVTELMYKVLERNKDTDVRFTSKAAAFQFRMKCYSARRKDKKSIAKHHNIELQYARSDFDKLMISIIEDKGGVWIARMSVVDLSMFDIVDTETQQPLSAEDEGMSLSDLGLEDEE